MIEDDVLTLRVPATMHDSTALAAVVTLIERAAGAPLAPDWAKTFFEASTTALRDDPPPFATDAYRDLAVRANGDPRRLLLTVLGQAEAEGQCARDDWAMADEASDRGEADRLRRRAHCSAETTRRLLALVDAVFASLIDADFRDQLDGLVPDLREGEGVADSRRSIASARADALLEDFWHDCRAARLAALWRDALEPLPAPARAAFDRVVDGRVERMAADAALIATRLGGETPAAVAEQVRSALRAAIELSVEEPVDIAFHARFGSYP